MKFHYPHDPDDRFDWDDYYNERDRFDEACEEREDHKRENYDSQ